MTAASVGAADTLPVALLQAGAAYTDVPLVVASAVRPATTTLGDLMEDARRVAGAFQRLGVQPGDVVAVQLPNWYEGAVAQIAAVLTGAVVLPVVQTYGPRELDFILRQSDAHLFVLAGAWNDRNHGDVLGGLNSLPALREVIVVADERPTRGMLFDDLLTEDPGSFEMPVPVADDVALLVYTSGTTANPKGVQHTHASLLAEVRSPVPTGPHGREAAHLAVLPSGHVAGLLGLMRMVLAGTRTVLLDAWRPDVAARLIDQHAVTWSVGAPVHLAGILDERDAGRATLASLRAYMVGAASVPASIVARAERAGIAAYRCYGSSEHPTVTSGYPQDPLSARAATDGRVIGANEVRIVDLLGNDLPAGADGEVVTRGPELFAGYRDESLNEEAFLSGGWYRTGDVGVLDRDGYLTIVDRMKDIIVRGGENISSKEVEDLLGQHPSVAEVAVIGTPDERMGERVCAVVVLREGSSLDLEDVSTFFRGAGIARHKTPERLEIVPSLPRTPAGKVQKVPLRQSLTGASTS